MANSVLRDIKNRFLQLLARELPGAKSFRLALHRWRGVKVGRGVCIGYDTIIETAHPELVTIKDGATVGIRCILLAHFWDYEKHVVVEEDAFIGPGSIILPNVVVGRGAVVAAGSVVTASVPPLTLVQGNPARPVAKLGKPPKEGVSYQQFVGSLRPIQTRTYGSPQHQSAHVAGDANGNNGRLSTDHEEEVRLQRH